MKQTLAGLACGLLFGIGLALAGMTDPAIVLGFLDVAGAWNPALLAVMALAVPTTLVGYRLVLRRPAPLFALHFAAAANAGVDARLVTGAALFGVGWGLSGYCPGPAIASLSGGATGLLVFLAAVAAGSILARRLLPGSPSLDGASPARA